MPEIDWREIHARLSSAEGMNVKVREGKYRYIDARQVMDRLDDVVGPENWWATFKVIPSDEAVVECSLTVLGITKVDVGYSNNPGSDYEKEPFKAAYSDALKRAAVHFGVGRFLYEDAPRGAAGSSGPRQSNTSQVPATTGQPARTSPPAAAAPAPSDEPLCCAEPGCGKRLTNSKFNDGTIWSIDQLAGYGRRKFGRVLCMTHYRAARQARDAEMLSAGAK